MFTITSKSVNLTASTDNINVAIGIADAVLEEIGEEVGDLTVSASGEEIIAVYLNGEYIIDGDVYTRFSDASDSMSYRIQMM